mgnify:CR=1 FL=1
MNLGLSDKDIAFREEVRAFLRDNLTPELAAAGKKATSVFVEPEYTLAWQKKLHAKGWAAPSWARLDGNAALHICIGMRHRRGTSVGTHGS